MEIEALDGFLAEHPFFRGMPPEQLATLAGCARNARFEAGQFLFREGEPANDFYVVRFGRVSVELFAPTRGPVTIETIDAGEVLGWSWLFSPYRWHFDARAATQVRTLALDAACLRATCEREPALGYALLSRFAAVVVRRLEATQLQLLDLYVEKT